MKKKKETLKEKITDLEQLIEVATVDGTWNYSPYLHGMANGMLFCLSVLTDEDPDYIDPPDVFLCDLEDLDKFNKSSIIVSNERN